MIISEGEMIRMSFIDGSWEEQMSRYDYNDADSPFLHILNNLSYLSTMYSFIFFSALLLYSQHIMNF